MHNRFSIIEADPLLRRLSRMPGVKITNIFGDRYSGAAGQAGVFATWKGIQYRRRYVIPANPKTTKQTAVRNHFSNAVDLWHAWSQYMHRCYEYLASGKAISGFNLLMRRYQNWKLSGKTAVADPIEGYKQIGHTKTAESDVYTALGAGHDTLTASPVVIMSAMHKLTGGANATDGVVDIEMGDIVIALEISKTDGVKDAGAALAEGDELRISYKSSGRVVTGELLYTVTGTGVIAAGATLLNGNRTKYWPIDLDSVVLYTVDDPSGAATETELQNLTVDNRNGMIRFSGVITPGDTDKVTYDSYTAIEDAKLEAVKSDTSFVTWREYSDAEGFIGIAQTIFDQPYDCQVEASGYDPVVTAAQNAAAQAAHEYIPMTAV